MPVHLLVQERVRPGYELLGPADVPERDLGDEGCERLRVRVECRHVRVLHAVDPVHLLDDELGVHHELSFALSELYDLGDRGDEPAVLGVVVGVDAEELRVLVHHLPVPHDDNSEGGGSGIPAGASVGVGGDQYNSSLETLFSPSTRSTLACMGSSTSSYAIMITRSPSSQRCAAAPLIAMTPLPLLPGRV